MKQTTQQTWLKLTHSHFPKEISSIISFSLHHSLKGKDIINYLGISLTTVLFSNCGLMSLKQTLQNSFKQVKFLSLVSILFHDVLISKKCFYDKSVKRSPVSISLSQKSTVEEIYQPEV